jgi:hypothetical protein
MTTKDEAMKQWGDELRADGLYVSSILRAAFSDGYTAGASERADAGKDAALTDEAILDEFERRAMKLRDFMGYPNPDGVRVIEGVRAILAANKEPK